MSTNSNLRRASVAKNDEFYTMYEDVAAELSAYAHLFQGKSVLCNCDRPESAFTRYFLDNMHALGLTRLTATHYTPNTTRGSLLTLSAGDPAPHTETLYGDGDFRSAHVSLLMMEHDIVVSNPPFSLFREYVDQLMVHGKEFAIVGSINALTYKNVFGYIQAGRLWTGNHRLKKFRQPDGSLTQLGNTCWFTNMPVHRLKEPIELRCKYTPEMYPRYDNYAAINVNRVRDIPVDYPGVMGVPITYLTVHCPAQFEIVGTRRWFYNPELCIGTTRNKIVLGGKELYDRVFIRHLNPEPAQFEIVGVDESSGKGLSGGLWDETATEIVPVVNGRNLYSRVFIRHLNPEPAQP